MEGCAITVQMDRYEICGGDGQMALERGKNNECELERPRMKMEQGDVELRAALAEEISRRSVGEI